MLNTLIVVFLAAISATGLFYALVYPHLSGQVTLEKRQAPFKQSTAARASERIVDQSKRRQQIIESLKDFDNTNKKKTQTIEAKLLQAGFDIPMRNFYIASVVLSVLTAAAVYSFIDTGAASGFPFTMGGGLVLGSFFVGGFGLPRWMLNTLIKRRKKKFLEEFPTSVDIIIRGVKAGLPIGQCLGIIASEAAEPVRTEFRKIVEAQSIGMSVGEAVERMPERMPLPEASFFSIVINLQQKAGGNLSEALGNLSRVLRDRKKMRAKIIAMSSEARASAMIIGALPFIVAFFVWISSPDYIMLLFTTPTGKMVLGVCAFWMSCGVFVMRRLINFDF